MYGAGAAFFLLEPEPTQFGWSRSGLQDLGLPEPEPPKKSGGSATLNTIHKIVIKIFTFTNEIY